uniref:Glycine N-acyltransferase-like protein n=1 Tax=Zosterops lateralis melanops TaxID=1220523 RepID=A0A8D2NKX7_ZOSLA
MKILTCPAHLQRLEGILRKSLPFALPVFGAVLNINRGNPGNYEVLVDKWPEFGAVLARPSGEVASGDMGNHRRGVTQCPDWGDTEGLGTGIVGVQGEQDPLTSPSPGLQDGMTTVSQNLAGRKGVELDIVDYYCYWTPLSPPLTPASPRPAPGVRVGSLSPSHVDLLNDTWPYGRNARSRRYLAEILGRFPQVCLQDGSGQPVAWVWCEQRKGCYVLSGGGTGWGEALGVQGAGRELSPPPQKKTQVGCPVTEFNATQLRDSGRKICSWVEKGR